MSINQIDSISGIDITQLTFSDIRIMYGTGRSTLVSGSGRDKVYKYRLGYQTKIGNIKGDIWMILAEQLIKHAGEEDIFARMLKYTKTIPWMKKESASEIKQKALDLHISRIFENLEWVDYDAFKNDDY